MRRRTKVVGLAGSLGLGASLALAAAAPASAHDVYQGWDWASHNYAATAFTICDAEDDGHGVWAGYYDSWSYTYHTAPVHYGSNAAGTDCSTYYVPGRYLTNIRVVEDKPGTSHNYYGAWHGYPVRHN